jgi:YHS domain-containing protein
VRKDVRHPTDALRCPIDGPAAQDNATERAQSNPWKILVVSLTVGAVFPLASEILLGTPAQCEPQAAYSFHTGLTNTQNGVAIKGTDPVAYFTEGRPVEGDPSISASIDGTVWWFTSQSHRTAFLQHPARYEPEYGGFCAYGISQGSMIDSDPSSFSIIGGRLYLYSSAAAQETWRATLVQSLNAADRNWAAIDHLARFNDGKADLSADDNPLLPLETANGS